MARIRSIHPGLFTDEAFASLSMAARVLLLGIWTEADDHGVFEWKPVTLKMRVMPADNVSIPELLSECEGVDLLKRFTDGKSYGLVRNFCRFQRPKKPKYVHPMPQELHTYAGLTPNGSLPVLHQSRTDGEKSPQREDGGGEGEEESGIEIKKGEGESAPAKIASQGLGSQIDPTFRPSLEALERCREQDAIDEDVDGELRKFVAHHQVKQTFSPNWDASWAKWWENWKPHKEKTARKSKVGTAPIDWDAVLSSFQKFGQWSRHAGPDLDSPACRAPKEMLEKYGLGLRRMSA